MVYKCECAILLHNERDMEKKLCLNFEDVFVMDKPGIVCLLL